MLIIRHQQLSFYGKIRKVDCKNNLILWKAKDWLLNSAEA